MKRENNAAFHNPYKIPFKDVIVSATINSKNIEKIYQEVQELFHTRIIGQKNMLEGMMIALLCEGHILLEGAPGLAKTYGVKTFAQILGLEFKRIQFTTDLLPADILGIEVYNPKNMKFVVKKGPLFSNVVLADEINRAPSKVQSALLEAMQEYQITIGETTYFLPKPYLILATQNPIEQEGTYPLPEAQIDRFMLKINVEYPSPVEEVDIVKHQTVGSPGSFKSLLTESNIAMMRKAMEPTHIENELINYIVRIVGATRNPESVEIDRQLIRCGVSPRGSIYLTKAAKAHAFLQGRDFVTPDDVKEMAPLVLAHRILMSYEAEATNVTQVDVVTQILTKIPTP